MKLGDLVKNEEGIIGIVDWINESWWHRKRGLTAIAVIIPSTGQRLWWKKKELEVISEAG